MYIILMLYSVRSPRQPTLPSPLIPRRHLMLRGAGLELLYWLTTHNRFWVPKYATSQLRIPICEAPEALKDWDPGSHAHTTYIFNHHLTSTISSILKHQSRIVTIHLYYNHHILFNRNQTPKSLESWILHPLHVPHGHWCTKLTVVCNTHL